MLLALPILARQNQRSTSKGAPRGNLQAELAELYKQYWGQHMRARGYFCATVGAVDEATIKAYLENPAMG